MEKKKKNITPAHAAFRAVAISAYSIMSLTGTLKYGNDGLDTWSAVCLAVAIVVGLANCAVSLITLKSKDRMTGGDEYTRKIIHKAGYIAFITTLLLIAVMFAILQGFMITNIENNITLKDFVDVRIVLCAIAGILLVSSFLYSLLLLIYSKRGIKDELQ